LIRKNRKGVYPALHLESF